MKKEVSRKYTINRDTHMVVADVSYTDDAVQGEFKKRVLVPIENLVSNPEATLQELVTNTLARVDGLPITSIDVKYFNQTYELVGRYAQGLIVEWKAPAATPLTYPELIPYLTGW